MASSHPIDDEALPHLKVLASSLPAEGQDVKTLGELLSALAWGVTPPQAAGMLDSYRRYKDAIAKTGKPPP